MFLYLMPHHAIEDMRRHAKLLHDHDYTREYPHEFINAMKEIRKRISSLSSEKLQAFGISPERVEKLASASVMYLNSPLFDEGGMALHYDYDNNAIKLFYGRKALAYGGNKDITYKILAHELGHYLYEDCYVYGRQTPAIDITLKFIPFSALVVLSNFLPIEPAYDTSAHLLASTMLSTAYTLGMMSRHHEHRADTFADLIVPEAKLESFMKSVDIPITKSVFLATIYGFLAANFMGMAHPANSLRVGLSEHRTGVKKNPLYDCLYAVPKGVANALECVGLKSLASQVRQFDYARDVRQIGK